MADKKKDFYLFQRANAAADNSGFSFFLDGSFLEDGQKVKFVFVKRAKGNKRVDLGKFFMDYRTFRSLFNMIERGWAVKRSKYTFSKSFYGGTDGKRRLIIEVKGKTMFFNCYDNLIKGEHDDYKSYTGNLMFSLNEPFDIQEFFDVRTTISNWEIANISKLLKVKNDPEKAEASK